MGTVADVTAFTLAVIGGQTGHISRVDDRLSLVLFAIPKPRRQLEHLALWRR